MSHWVGQEDLALLTDLYELTMMQVYHDRGAEDLAVFSLFVRRLPKRRQYLIAAGLEDVLDYLQNLAFSEEKISYLKSLGKFSTSFLDRLRDFRFSGDVWATPEGTPLFAEEPFLEVIAPLPQAQLIETFVMNQIHLQTVLASKASRIVDAAEGKGVVDFGLRRMHGVDAGLKSARSFWIAGLKGTSNVLAGEVYGIPITGTMAHSFVQSHNSELQAFRDFVRTYPETILLVDTYDTLEGVKKVIELSHELREDFCVRGIRLDSGDLARLSKEARKLLDEAGLEDLSILASGGLSEEKIKNLIDQHAPIDGFGVGTGLGVSEDAPSLDFAYKLTSYAGQDRVKSSSEKATLPGQKQIFRKEKDGRCVSDTIASVDETLSGRPLLKRVMQNGKKEESVSLNDIRSHCEQEKRRLPDFCLDLHSEESYTVKVSKNLQERYQRSLEFLKKEDSV